MLCFVLLAFGTTAAVVATDIGTLQHDPHFKPNRTVIVQLFEWKFTDIARECEEFLGPRGFGGVQVSPVNEHVVWKDFARPWWERYHPISYEIITRSGGREQFQAMTRACNDAGVRVYVDVVLNHMAAPRKGNVKLSQEDGDDGQEVKVDEANSELMEGTGGSTANATVRDYPTVPYREEHFHRRCDIVDFTDGHQMRNCEYKMLPDLDHSQAYVREKIVDFLSQLVDMGAAGFRVDAAKYMWPVDLRDMFASVKDLNTDYDFPRGSRPFFLQEVIDLGEQAISKTEYIGYGVVIDSMHSAQISAIFNGKKPLSSLINWGPAMGFLLSSDAVVFVDTHYIQRGHGLGKASAATAVLTNKEAKKYTMAVAFMLAHPYGIKRIMSSFRFENNDQGPPADEDDAITSPEFNDDDEQCTEESGWVCEHRWIAIANMVGFANFVAGESINSFQNAGPNHVAFCRGNKGFIALNNDPEVDLDQIMYACVQPGDYCDVVSGSLIDGECTGKMVTVDEARMANVSLSVDAEHGVMAIYEGSRLD